VDETRPVKILSPVNDLIDDGFSMRLSAVDDPRYTGSRLGSTRRWLPTTLSSLALGRYLRRFPSSSRASTVSGAGYDAWENTSEAGRWSSSSIGRLLSSYRVQGGGTYRGPVTPSSK
jgi:hypothetical protein